jgi:hypothetical protein
MIRDFLPDPLPQSCPFSFIAQLKKNGTVSTEAFLGALRYDNCQIPEDSEDPVSREIKDWFAFAVDDKTAGLWGYYDQGNYNFKITTGGKKTGPPPENQTEGQDQALLEMWNQYGYGLTHYVNEGDGDAQAEGTANRKQAGYYYYSPGAANYSQLFVTDGESSIWGFTDGLWQYKLAAESNSTIFQIWRGANGTSDDPPAGYAQMYAYADGAGFSCSLSDDESSTLAHYELFIKNFEAYTSLSPGDLYLNDGETWVDISPPGEDCYFQQVEFCADGETRTAYVLMSEPK